MPLALLSAGTKMNLRYYKYTVAQYMKHKLLSHRWSLIEGHAYQLVRTVSVSPKKERAYVAEFDFD